MTFQKKVLVISVIILIGTLALIGYMLHKAQSSTTYPPEISMCPDFWEVFEESPGETEKGAPQTGKLWCKPNADLGDKGNIGSWVAEGTPGGMDFSKPEYVGPKGLSKKKDWADGLGIYWDGITDMYTKGPKPTQEGK